MKKKIFLSLIVLVATAGSIMAQETSQKPNVHAKETYFKLKADLSLVGEQDAKVYQVFEDYYSTEMKIKDEMSHAGNTDANRMKDNMERITTVRNAKLKVILTEVQMAKFVNEVEATLNAKAKPEDNKQ